MEPYIYDLNIKIEHMELYRVFSDQNNEMAAMLLYQTDPVELSSFLTQRDFLML